MKKYLFLSLITLFTLLKAYGQDSLCLEINFESELDSLGLGNFEGTVISDQFLESYGLSFSLEGGGFPILAEVGGQTPSAFGSAWGFDTPDPIDAAFIGSFFLTDDGILQGLEATPIILEFSTSIDSFTGCILDMDFGEVFKVEAFNRKNERILLDSIQDGDPNTGDGRATCWGFKIPSCEEPVSKLKFSGKRITNGSFGLGLDNLSFCRSDFRKIDLQQITSQDPTDCLFSNGVINVIAAGGEGELSYSLNQGVFSDIAEFQQLGPGEYTITVKDRYCELSDSVELEAPICQIYTPNIISDNNDGVNEEFYIRVDPNYQLEVLNYRIYDRWGELIFHSENFSAHDDNTPEKQIWWNGTTKKKEALEGVYAYYINVRHQNGTLADLTGTVTLVR